MSAPKVLVEIPINTIHVHKTKIDRKLAEENMEGNMGSLGLGLEI
jgi:hypothetical protein